MAEFTVQGEEMIDRIAEETESGVKISVPESWDEQHVKVIRTDHPLALRSEDEFVAEDIEIDTGDGEVNENGDNGTIDAVSEQNQTRDAKRIVKNTVAELNTGNGAPISDVVEKVQEEEGITAETCIDVIDELRRCGEVYEPTEKRLKRT